MAAREPIPWHVDKNDSMYRTRFSGDRSQDDCPHRKKKGRKTDRKTRPKRPNPKHLPHSSTKTKSKDRQSQLGRQTGGHVVDTTGPDQS